MTDTFGWRAEVDTTGDTTLNVSSAKFGDGFKQEVPDGLNGEIQTWNVKVSGLGRDMQLVIDFLRAHIGKSFYWKPPFSIVAGYYSCKKYSQSDAGGAYWTIVMTFEQGYMP